MRVLRVVTLPVRSLPFVTALTPALASGDVGLTLLPGDDSRVVIDLLPDAGKRVVQAYGVWRLAGA